MRNLNRHEAMLVLAIVATLALGLAVGLAIGRSTSTTASQTVTNPGRVLAMVMVDGGNGLCRARRCRPRTTTTTPTTPTVTVTTTTVPTTTPLPTTTTPTTTTTPLPTDGWTNAISTDFTTDGVLPAPWVAYNFANSNEQGGYYLTSHAVVANGSLSLVQRYDATGPARTASYEADGGGWYQGTVYSGAASSVDHRVTMRMRIVSTGGVGSHRNLPLWWANSENWQTDGEEDFFESDPKWVAPDSLGREEPRSFFHYNLNGVPNTVVYWIWPRIDLAQWHTYRLERRNHKITIWVDDMVTPIFSRQYTATELPDTAKHPVFQQENANYVPPAGTTGSEAVEIDWVKVDVPT